MRSFEVSVVRRASRCRLSWFEQTMGGGGGGRCLLRLPVSVSLCTPMFRHSGQPWRRLCERASTSAVRQGLCYMRQRHELACALTGCFPQLLKRACGPGLTVEHCQVRACRCLCGVGHPTSHSASCMCQLRAPKPRAYPQLTMHDVCRSTHPS